MRKDRTTSGAALIELSGSGPAHRRLAEAIRAAIRDGRLRPGDVVPASRNLAGDLGISRWVVTEAYQQLAAEGFLTTRAGSATRIADAATTLTPAPLPEESLEGDEVLPPGAVDLRPGLPDVAAFPRAAWTRAYAATVRSLTPNQWRYPDPHGVPALRSTVADYVRRVRGVDADQQRVLITGGTTDAIRHLSRFLVTTGTKRLVVEDPGWPTLAAAASGGDLSVEPVPVDREGLVVAALPTSHAAVLVTPAHQFPTGVALSAARRTQLLRWAADTGSILIEDDYDAEYRYDRRPVGALAGLDPDRVVYLGSVSKTLAPALRLGWLVAPPPLRRPLEQAFSDASRSALEQHALAALMANGDYDRHLRRMRRKYEQRRDLLLTALRSTLTSLQVSGVAAGLHLLVRLPDAVADIQVADRLTRQGILVTPLSRYQHRRTDSGIVVGFARLTADQAPRVGLELARTLQHVLR